MTNCKQNPKASTYLKAYDECAKKDVLIDIKDLPDFPDMKVCDILANCTVVTGLQAKITKQKETIATLQTQVDGVAGNVVAVAEEVAKLKDKDSSVDKRIDEINSNISLLKGWNIKQDTKIKSMSIKVIRDDLYLNFGDWVENVYLQNCDATVNKYIKGSIYVNVNQSVDAKNATYVYVKDENDKTPCSANDWQILYYSSPADVLAILGIGPIVVTHPYKHEWVVELDETKFKQYIAAIDALDFTNVAVTLNSIKGTPVFEGEVTFRKNVTFEEEVQLEDLRVTDELEVERLATVKDLKIKGLVLEPVRFAETVTIQESLNVANMTTTGSLTVNQNANIARAHIEHLTVPGYSNDLQWIIQDIYSKI